MYEMNIYVQSHSNENRKTILLLGEMHISQNLACLRRNVTFSYFSMCYRLETGSFPQSSKS